MVVVISAYVADDAQTKEPRLTELRSQGQLIGEQSYQRRRHNDD